MAFTYAVVMAVYDQGHGSQRPASLVALASFAELDLQIR